MAGQPDNTSRPCSHEATASPAAAPGSVATVEASERGASLVEYALLLILVLVVAFFTVQIFGDSLVALFDAMSGAFD